MTLKSPSRKLITAIVNNGVIVYTFGILLICFLSLYWLFFQQVNNE